jgi:SAM-dependent methyltransferase
MDIFGDALLDFEAGRRGRMLTIHRDDGHVDGHDPALYFAEAPFEHEARLLEHAKGPVLDVGCGAGRTLLWLQHRGMAATGVDVSPGAVDVCRKRGCQDVRLLDVMATDAAGDGAFQTIVLFGNNAGIGGTMHGAGQLLSRLAHVTMPGGCLLVTGLDIAKTSEPHHLDYHQRNRAAGRPVGEIAMRFEYEGAIGPWVQWFHPEPAELERLAREAGWEVEEISSVGGPFYAAALQKPR